MPWIIKMFPEGMQNLNLELASGLHPKLEKLLNDQPSNEWEIKLAIIAKYCDIIVDGDYDENGINQLCAICAGRLEVLRELPTAQKILPLN